MGDVYQTEILDWLRKEPGRSEQREVIFDELARTHGEAFDASTFAREWHEAIQEFWANASIPA